VDVGGHDTIGRRSKPRRKLQAVDVLVIAEGGLHGNITEVERAGRVKGRAHLAFRFTEVEHDGQRDQLRTAILSFDGAGDTKGDVTKIGGGAGIGAVIGGIVGGAGGAAKGAASGGGAGTGAVLATRGKEVELPAGTDLNTTLSSPFDVRVSVR